MTSVDSMGSFRCTRHSPWVTYPPVDAGVGSLASVPEIVTVERSDWFRIEESQIAATPRNSLALVMTPNDPTGTVLGAPTAAQLVRRVSLLILDERSAELQRRSMIRLVEEFDSIVLLRSFADWAGLGEDAPGYAIASPQIAESIDRSSELNAHGLHAAMAAVSNASKLDAIAQRVRLERIRLYRMLRKLNLVMPYPSDAGYVLAHVTRGDRDAIAGALLERDIAVYSPPQPRLATTLAIFGDLAGSHPAAPGCTSRHQPNCSGLNRVSQI